MGPEDPVHPPGVESQGAQEALEFGDVVSSHHRALEVEQAIPEAIAGLDQGRPRGEVAYPGLGEAPMGLEGADRGVGALTKTATGFDGCVESHSGQSLLEITDRVALSTEVKWKSVHG